MNLKHLSNSELLHSTQAAVSDERGRTSQVLHHLKEVEARRLHLELGCPSMFAYCMTELGYDEHQTQRRLSAMRLLRELPEIEKQIVAGKLSLTALNQAKTVFNKMAKKNERLRASQKLDILKTLENKSLRECQKELIKICPEELPQKMETQRPLTEELSELKLILPQTTLMKLERLKNLLSHQTPQKNTAQLIDDLIEEKLSKIDPLKKTNAAPHASAQVQKGTKDFPKPPLNSGPSVLKASFKRMATDRSRYIPASVRRQVWRRDQGRCIYTSSQSKKSCGSTFQLQIDHIVPFALGGSHDADNLQLLCRAHNQFHAVQTFGIKKMRGFIPNFVP